MLENQKVVDLLCCNGLELSMQDFQVRLYMQEMSTTESGSVTLEEEAWEESKHLKQNRAHEIPPSVFHYLKFTIFPVTVHLIVPPLKITLAVSWRMSSGNTVPLAPLHPQYDPNCNTKPRYCCPVLTQDKYQRKGPTSLL